MQADDRFRALPARSQGHLEGQQGVDFVEKPGLGTVATGVGGGCERDKFGRCASRREGRRRKQDELRQFPQILGGGGQ
jgi:hypothetical protein